MMRRAWLLLLLSLSACEESADAPQEAPPSVGVQNLPPPPPSGHIRGELHVAPALAAKVATGDIIYLIARNAATGGVIAVAKLAAPERFPLPFELGGEHVMMPGGSLSGKVRLSVRVDKDGNATTKQPGDVTGELPELVDVPKEGVVLTLNETL